MTSKTLNLAILSVAITGCNQPSPNLVSGAQIVESSKLAGASYLWDSRGRSSSVFTSSKSELQSWSMPGLKKSRTVTLKNPISYPEFSHDGNQLWIIDSKGHLSSFVLERSGEAKELLNDYTVVVAGQDMPVSQMVALPDGDLLVNCNAKGVYFLARWQNNRLQLLQRYQKHVIFLGTANTEDAYQAYAITLAPNTSIYRVDLASGLMELDIYRDKETVNGRPLTGGRFLLARADGSIELIRNGEPKVIDQFPSNKARNWIGYIAESNDRIVIFDKHRALVLNQEGEKLGIVTANKDCEFLSISLASDDSLLATVKSWENCFLLNLKLDNHAK